MNYQSAPLKPKNLTIKEVKLPISAASFAAGFVHCLIHTQLAAFELPAVSSRDSGICLVIASHFDKAEPFGVIGLSIVNDLG